MMVAGGKCDQYPAGHTSRGAT